MGQRTGGSVKRFCYYLFILLKKYGKKGNEALGRAPTVRGRRHRRAQLGGKLGKYYHYFLEKRKHGKACYFQKKKPFFFLRSP